MKQSSPALNGTSGASFEKQGKQPPAVRPLSMRKAAKNGAFTHNTSGLDLLVQPSLRTDLSKSVKGIEVHVLCIYSTVDAGKLARQWIETAFQTSLSNARAFIEYFNYAVLSDDEMNWADVMRLVNPDIILLLSDGNTQLVSGLRHSLRELLTQQHNGSKPLVIFRNLEPEPTLNTRILLDYVSALSQQGNFELKAVNESGIPIGCFRHQRHLLKSRIYQE